MKTRCRRWLKLAEDGANFPSNPSSLFPSICPFGTMSSVETAVMCSGTMFCPLSCLVCFGWCVCYVAVGVSVQDCNWLVTGFLIWILVCWQAKCVPSMLCRTLLFPLCQQFHWLLQVHQSLRHSRRTHCQGSFYTPYKGRGE